MKCDFCGKEFEPQGNRNLTRRRFCSKKCRTDFGYYREPKPEKRRTLKTAEPRTCVTCGEEFTPDANHDFAVTCSRKCSGLYQRRKRSEKRRIETSAKLNIPRTCTYCGKEYIPYHWQQAFCCSECKKLNDNKRSREYRESLPTEVIYQRNAQSRLNGNWLKAIERDNYQCQICLGSENIRVHHVNGEGEKKHGKRQKDDSRLENLLSVCEQCHKDIHGIFLVCKNGKWYVQGKIFDKIGMYGSIEIFNKPNNGE